MWCDLAIILNMFATIQNFLRPSVNYESVVESWYGEAILRWLKQEAHRNRGKPDYGGSSVTTELGM